MAVLTIRNVPENVRDRLRLRAAQAGTSMEAEVRAILLHAIVEQPRRTSAQSLQKWVQKLYGNRKPEGVVDALIAERRRESRSERARK